MLKLICLHEALSNVLEGIVIYCKSYFTCLSHSSNLYVFNEVIYSSLVCFYYAGIHSCFHFLIRVNLVPFLSDNDLHHMLGMFSWLEALSFSRQIALVSWSQEREVVGCMIYYYAMLYRTLTSALAAYLSVSRCL